jgi:hypothetical protein
MEAVVHDLCSQIQALHSRQNLLSLLRRAFGYPLRVLLRHKRERSLAKLHAGAFSGNGSAHSSRDSPALFWQEQDHTKHFHLAYADENKRLILD